MTKPKTIVITGGGSGIGAAAAAQFAAQGDHVFILGRTEDKLRRVADALGGLAGFHVVDVSQRESVQTAIDSIVQSAGEIHTLVNNAGAVEGLTADMPLAQAESIWEREIDINLKGAFLMAVGCAPHLVRPGGRIINIGSIAAHTGGTRGGVIGYGTAKAGLHGLTCALARELSPHRITVNTVSPGLIDQTDFFGAPLTAEQVQSRVEAIPIGRAGSPDDVAGVICFLASAQADYITGEILQVNGGWLFGR